MLSKLYWKKKFHSFSGLKSKDKFITSISVWRRLFRRFIFWISDLIVCLLKYCICESSAVAKSFYNIEFEDTCLQKWILSKLNLSEELVFSSALSTITPTPCPPWSPRHANFKIITKFEIFLKANKGPKVEFLINQKRGRKSFVTQSLYAFRHLMI